MKYDEIMDKYLKEKKERSDKEHEKLKKEWIKWVKIYKNGKKNLGKNNSVMKKEQFMNYDEMKEKYLKEQNDRREKKRAENKKKWIEQYGEEHYNHSQKIIEKIGEDVSEILFNDKKNKEEK